MKNLKNILFLAVPIFFLVVFSCKKDKEESKNKIEESYFTIENSTYVNGSFPAASTSNAPVINSVFGNSSVLEGGSNPITINTTASVKEILIGVEGKAGYYKIQPSALKAASMSYLVYLLFSQNFEAESFTIVIAIVDTNGQVSEHQSIHVAQIIAGTGKLQVSCSWNRQNDLDLHLVEPNGFDVNWDTDSSANGGVLDVDSNPICFIDNINSENITYSGTAKIENGVYKVRISLFSDCEITEVTNYVVTARLNGNLITPSAGTNPYYGKVLASHSYLGGDGPRGGDIVMEFNVSSQKSGTMENQRMLQFDYPRKKNLAKKAFLTR